MGVTRRREHVGRFASAALPALWKALERKGWSHADLARYLDLSNGQTAKLLYGDTHCGLSSARLCLEQFGIALLLWEKPCPPNWRPQHRPRPRSRREDHLAPTGTD
jgi:hypothetical protein